jgi:ABC-type polysaccharide/polyol phosphate export permease
VRAAQSQKRVHVVTDIYVPSLLGDRLQRRLADLFSRPNLDLLIELIRAHVKTSDQGSIVGVVWGLVNPIITLIVLYLLFSRRFGTEIPTYSLYLLLGIVVVSFFTSATRDMMQLFPSKRSILTNVTVPSETLAVAGASTVTYKLAVELLMCIALSAWYGALSVSGVLLAVPLLLAYLALTAGVAMVLSTVRVYCKDADRLWSASSRVLFFGTPVFYTLDSLSPWARSLIYWLNPLTPFVVSFRNLLMGRVQIDWGAYGHSLLIGLVVLIVGYAIFLRLERAAVESA